MWKAFGMNLPVECSKTTYSYGKQVYIPDYKSRERSFVSGF